MSSTTETRERRKRDTLCVTAGVAAAVVVAVGIILAIGAIIALLVWGTTNHGPIIAGAIAGAIIVLPVGIVSTGGIRGHLHVRLGAPGGARDQDVPGEKGNRPRRNAQQGRGQIQGQATTASRGSRSGSRRAGNHHFPHEHPGDRMSTENAAALSGVILGSITGAGVGIGITTQMVMDCPY